MPYVLFHNYFPNVAEQETRSLTVLPDFEAGLPAGNYAFLEMFCDKPGCDCRRVFFSVFSSLTRSVVAVVAWGWEEPKFYARWMGDNDPEMLAILKGPDLNLASRQTRLAPSILKLIRNVLLQDPQYIERIKRHYKMFQGRINKRSR